VKFRLITLVLVTSRWMGFCVNGRGIFFSVLTFVGGLNSPIGFWF